ncbi:MAG TPA: PQQ-binding-like beta-propeller repeat protein, partial [Ktedonobacteraceae bacterium]|nr:PQQ-binding-like beta-propeller repeat protein [Ktedonobacteraceae bacterium]
LYWREALSVHDGFVTFSSTDNATYILDANNGHEVLALPATSFPSFLAIDGQIVYTMPSTFSASYTGQQTASVSPTIQAFHLPDGQRLWSHSFSGETQIYAETADTIYATEMLETKLTAIQSNDGHKLWTYHASNGSSIRSFITANGFGYLLQADATLVCLRLNDGYPLWQRQIKALKNGAAITATLTMQGDTLLLYDADSEMTSPLYALSSNDGHVLWQTAEPVPVPFFQAGTLYTIENRGQVDAWRIADGKHLWSFSAPAGTTIIQQIHSPSDLLFLLNLTNTLVVLRITDGRMLWRYP